MPALSGDGAMNDGVGGQASDKPQGRKARDAPARPGLDSYGDLIVGTRAVGGDWADGT